MKNMATHSSISPSPATPAPAAVSVFNSPCPPDWPADSEAAVNFADNVGRRSLLVIAWGLVTGCQGPNSDAALPPRD